MRPYGLALVAAVFACGAACDRAARPNVVLVTIDTLRADRLGAYGGRDVPTPHVDRLAREGLLFENAVCPMPMTRPSHFSIMTSRYPRQHGVVNNAIALPAEAVTLPEVLRQAGYRTGAFVGVRLMAAPSGAAQGFDTFVAPAEENAWAADRVVPGALHWLALQDGRPFFLWLHLFDPHMPYAPPPAFRPAPAAEWPDAPSEISWPGLLSMADAAQGVLSTAVLDRGLALYAGEVAFTDHWLGILLAALQQRGVLERTVVAFTADHGECFDHGIYFEHSDCLYDGAVKVPLIVRYPPAVAAGRRDGRLVENLDIAPTLLRLAGVPIPTEFRGTDRLGTVPASEAAGFLERPLYQPEVAANRPQRNAHIRTLGGRRLRPVAPGEERVGLRTAEWKFIQDGSAEELYDLRADPTESRNLAGERSDVAGRLRARLRAWKAAHPLRLADESKVNPALRETLRALGYVQ
jgi:choline-sulfatase